MKAEKFHKNILDPAYQESLRTSLNGEVGADGVMLIVDVYNNGDGPVKGRYEIVSIETYSHMGYSTKVCLGVGCSELEKALKKVKSQL